MTSEQNADAAKACEPPGLRIEKDDDPMEKRQIADGDDEPVSAEDKAELETYQNELAARYAQLDALIKDNADPSKSEYPAFTKTDSTLKRNTAFVKKLKSYTEAQRESLLRELPALNLTKYLEEVANALLEAKLRTADLPGVLLINCLLHRNYPAYAELALKAWHKQLPTAANTATATTNTSSGEAGGGGGKLNQAKLRVDLRLFADLVLARVVPTLPGLKLLGQCLQFLTAGDAEFNHCGLVCHLLGQAGDAFIGRLPTRKAGLAVRLGTALPRAEFLEPEARRPFHRLLSDYCKRLTSALAAKGTELGQLDRGNRRVLNSKGELSQDRRDAFEACKKEVDRLLGLATQLCNLIGEPAPELPPIGADDLDEEERAVADAVSAPAGAGRLPGLDEAAGVGRFEDEDARQFYEQLPDLRPMLPEVLVREAKERMELSKKSATESQGAPSAEAAPAEAAPDGEPSEEVLERELEAEEAAAAEAASSATDTAAATDADVAEAGDTAGDEAGTPAATVATTDAATNQRQVQLDQFIASLPTMVNRDMIDKAAMQFATALNSKAARRRLVQAMLTVHRSRCDLLPFYARLAAVLCPVAPEVADDLRQRLQRDFKHAFHKKDHTNLESKLKIVRFIGELVKFGQFPLDSAATDLKLLVINFSNHSIELACALLESCGRYMYATKETHLRMKVYLRNLWNKKTKLVSDERLIAMIENAYYSVAPPDNSRMVKAVQLPPVMQFVQKLLFKDLCNASVEKVLRLCLSLPWDDPAVEQFVVRSFTSVWCVPYGAVHCLASVLAGLAPYYQSAAIAVVDGVLEDIRLGMEINSHRLNQRRIACTRYLGEMYNYCLVESGLVFNTLHSFLSLGVCLSPEADTPLDPPEHLLRIRLACVLLETCGQYFDSGSNRKKLDAFLLYLQQYYWFKRCHPVWSTEERPFPLDIEFLYCETVETLRPKFKHAASFDEARALVARQEKVFLAKLERMAAKLRQQQLPAISEAAAAGHSAPGTDEEESSDLLLDDDDAGGGGSTTEDGEDDIANAGGGKRRGGGGGGGGEHGNSQSETEDADAPTPEVSGDGGGRNCRPELMACPEDEDFVRAFERTLAGEFGGGGGGTSGPGLGPALSASASAAGLLSMSAEAAASDAVAAGLELPASLRRRPDDVQQQQLPTVAFTVMSRRGGGPRSQQPTIQLPADSQLARRYLAAVEAAVLEREAVKRATLSITAAQMAQEDLVEAGAAAADAADGGGQRRTGAGGGGGGSFRRLLPPGNSGRY